MSMTLLSNNSTSVMPFDFFANNYPVSMDVAVKVRGVNNFFSFEQMQESVTSIIQNLNQKIGFSSHKLTTLAVGVLLSATTSNPLFLICSSLSLVKGVNAQNAQQMIQKSKQNTFNIVHSARQQAQGKIGPISSHMGTHIVTNEEIKKCRIDLIKELGVWTPSFKTQLLNCGLDILSIVFDAWDVSNISRGKTKPDDLISTMLNWPVEELKKKFNEHDKTYWLDIVEPEYRDIFNEPTREAFLIKGDEAVIYFMKKKLASHGYIPGFGTPLQFVNYLKAKGICEIGGRCRNQEL